MHKLLFSSKELLVVEIIQLKLLSVLLRIMNVIFVFFFSRKKSPKICSRSILILRALICELFKFGVFPLLKGRHTPPLNSKNLKATKNAIFSSGVKPLLFDPVYSTWNNFINKASIKTNFFKFKRP